MSLTIFLGTYAMKQKTQFFFVIALMVALSLCLSPSQVAAWGRGHFYVIGTGPAGPQMATLQALNTIKRMDVIISSDKHAKLFAEYIGNKSIPFDPWTGFWDYKGKSRQKLSKEETARFKVERFRIRDKRVEQIKLLLAEGKDVGLLDSGNPCLFGPSHWYVESFDPDDLVIIPGLGCDAAPLCHADSAQVFNGSGHERYRNFKRSRKISAHHDPVYGVAESQKAFCRPWGNISV